MKKRKILNLIAFSTPLFLGTTIVGCANNRLVKKYIVNTFNELKNIIETDAKTGFYDSKIIEITEDIVVSEPIYVMNDTTITCDSDHSITRAPSFLDDMFVVGEDEHGTNPIISGERAILTFSTTNNASLTIDGNKSSISSDTNICGSAIFVSNHSIVNLNKNVTIKNCRKDINKRCLDKRMEKTEEAGGSALLIVSGVFNMYGGSITDCNVTGVEGSSNNDNVCYMGGAIYNEGGLNIFDGSINNCEAWKGGAIYNYTVANIFSGSFENNHANKYGGAIYLPNSQYVQLNLGTNNNENKLIFNNNSSSASGGCIFGTHQSVIYILGNTDFTNNYVESGNGGAINSYGTLLANGTLFKLNSSNSKGGAVYLYNDTAKGEQKSRQSEFINCIFDQNSSPTNGGAISFAGTNETDPIGPIGLIKNTTFANNASKQGGAIYLNKETVLDIQSSSFNENKSSDKGGAIYSTNSTVNLLDDNIVSAFYKNSSTTEDSGAISVHTNSILNIYNAKFLENSANGNAGAIGGFSQSIINIFKSEFEKNNCLASKASSNYGGGAMYLNSCTLNILSNNDNDVIFKENTSNKFGGALCIYESASANITNVSLSQNIANQYGGAIYASGASNTIIDNVIATANSGSSGGFLYITTSNTSLIIKQGEAYDNIATGGESKGSCIWGNSAKAILKIKGFSSGEQIFFKYNGIIDGVEGFEVIDYEEN